MIFWQTFTVKSLWTNPAMALMEKMEKITTATNRMLDVSLETKTLSNKNFIE